MKENRIIKISFNVAPTGLDFLFCHYFHHNLASNEAEKSTIGMKVE